ncbi:MAG: UDP-N-acetylmuramoyl-L-alanyl-D-glutamate--2,6-diaminopimelate ligase [Chloroflexi bacterium]|nr:UDP-N-acetylmuramoyl-L-alanyl-D-glutamate--2,6-diaminopimelate ligase [Chloroflexota bacterium]
MEPGTPRGGAESIAALLRAAEPATSRALSGLVDRLRSHGDSVSIVWPGVTPSGRVSVDGGGDDRSDAALAAIMLAGVTADSRSVGPGSLFVAIPGSRADGHRFAADAEGAGAAALLVEHALPDRSIPQILVPHARPMLAEAAAWWYGDPARELGVVGITGTDGKTTTSFLAASALEATGIRTGLLGTVAIQIGGRREANQIHSTTPEAPYVQRALRAMTMAGDAAAIIETTSHGLAMDRVRAIDYDVAILTNLTHEHLELHGSFEAYRSAKLRLFESLVWVGMKRAGRSWPRTGIVNVDDPSAAIFVAATRAAGARAIGFGAARDAEVRLLGTVDDHGGLRVDYGLAGSQRAFRLQLAGRFNAHNALAAVALGWALDLDPSAVESGLEAVAAVAGRMELVDQGQPFSVVIDYAHSPASLATVLDELGPRAAAGGGGLIAVFGSAGERDRDKRPMMGRIAAERCRIVILTDEDPRGEGRGAILGEIAAGAGLAGHRPEAILQVADRSVAIRTALERARPGDVVLLAGKGHETTIEYADRQLPWDERAEAERALADLGWGR